MSKFKELQLVRVIPSAFCTGRTDRIAKIDTSPYDGRPRIWLEDGGLFSEDELEAVIWTVPPRIRTKSK